MLEQATNQEETAAANQANADDGATYAGRATYSPDDNKLRLYPAGRLDSATYARMKEAGFKWAPRQSLFVAPMWTPTRADLLAELCGDIEDDDSSLVDRAEERAERFEGYSDNRQEDATRERDRVATIADGIPFGQPILVGHHSERRARKDAARIESGMRRAVRMWETSKYWKARAAGAVAHAKYKELPAVRHRRIKGIESDVRKYQKLNKDSALFLALWRKPDLTREDALKLANVDQGLGFGAWSSLDSNAKTAAEVAAEAIATHTARVERCNRWLAHCEFRLEYERAMLNEQLGVDSGGMAGRFAFAAGGRVLVGREWLVILRVNKAAGAVNSLTTSPPAGVTWSSKWNIGVEQVADYKAPTEKDSAAVAKATKLPPLVNYPGESFLVMTAEEWKRKQAAGSGCVRKAKATEEFGAYRFRESWIPGGSYKRAQVYLSDEKTKERPPANPNAAPVTFEQRRELPSDYAAPRPKLNEDATDSDFLAMKESLKTGAAVAVAVAPQLFPTPPDLARRMVALAGIKAIGGRILEPSAGTGNLVRAAVNMATGFDCCKVTAVESSPSLVAGLEDMRRRFVNANESNFRIVSGDFLEQTPEALGLFDLVLMNPPFANAADVRHIEHAATFLKDGGILVAICANGPRQRESLMSLADHWEDLPAGTFKEAGTNVSTALLVIRKGVAQ